MSDNKDTKIPNRVELRFVPFVRVSKTHRNDSYIFNNNIIAVHVQKS